MYVRERVGGLSAGHYQMPCLKLFLISSGEHIQGTNFGISLCLWIGGDKRPLMALSPPLLFSAPIASLLSFFLLSIWAVGAGAFWSLIKWGEMGSGCAGGEAEERGGGAGACQAQSSVIQSLQHPLRQLF